MLKARTSKQCRSFTSIQPAMLFAVYPFVTDVTNNINNAITYFIGALGKFGRDNFNITTISSLLNTSRAVCD